MIVTLLTDYGRDDDFVGVCHGVIRSIAPDARIIDITHGIPRYAVRAGAIVMRNTLPFMPVGVHVAVVDPQVGTERRAVALHCRSGRVLVGPDNGLLSLASEVAGGVRRAVDVTSSPFRLEPVSATFHGRDVFAPVAAHLAAGLDPAAAGPQIEPSTLAGVQLPRAYVEDGTLVAHVLIIDRFGNASLNVDHGDLIRSGMTPGAPVELQVGDERHLATYARAFGDVEPGELLVYQDAYRALAVAINRGDAAGALGLTPDAELRLSRR